MAGVKESMRGWRKMRHHSPRHQEIRGSSPKTKSQFDGFSSRIAIEAQNGITAQILKDRLFNMPLAVTLDKPSAQAAARGIM